MSVKQNRPVRVCIHSANKSRASLNARSHVNACIKQNAQFALFVVVASVSLIQSCMRSDVTFKSSLRFCHVCRHCCRFVLSSITLLDSTSAHASRFEPRCTFSLQPIGQPYFAHILPTADIPITQPPSFRVVWLCAVYWLTCRQRSKCQLFFSSPSVYTCFCADDYGKKSCTYKRVQHCTTSVDCWFVELLYALCLCSCRL